MKNTVSLILFYLLIQATGLLAGGVAAQSSASDTLCDVGGYDHCHTQTKTVHWITWTVVDGLGDGTAEWLPDSLSHTVISHVNPQPGNYACGLLPTTCRILRPTPAGYCR
jgi:hypothetical protein